MRSRLTDARGSLYTPDELYDGMDDGGYTQTVDARAYAWSQDAAIRYDAYVSVLRAMHDEAMSDALHAPLSDRPAVGVMGVHAVARGTEEFASVAHLGHRLSEKGYLVVTGAAPGPWKPRTLAPGHRTAQRSSKPTLI